MLPTGSGDPLSEDHEEITVVPEKVRKAWESKPSGYTREQSEADSRTRDRVPRYAVIWQHAEGGWNLLGMYSTETEARTQADNWKLPAGGMVRLTLMYMEPLLDKGSAD